MRSKAAVCIDRRSILLGAAAAGLVLGFRLPIGVAQAASNEHALNAWVRIGADDSVTVLLSQCEIGQGISTTLPAILADELGADWSRLGVENSPIAPAYQNPRYKFMFTGNSESIQAFSDPMREAGAMAREMLIAAAAQRWGVAPVACGTENGVVIHGATGRRLSFGALAEAAAEMPVPSAPKLKAPAELKLVGRAVPRRDVPEKVDGSAVFGIDVKVPGMVHAAVRLAPVFGGAVARFDADSVLKMPGVIAVVPLQNGIAVVAERFWQARKAADALDVTFADGSNGSLGSPALDAQYRAALDSDDWGTISNHGDAQAAIASGANVITREYASPFQAHAALEPMNCTASVMAEGCEIWVPTQGPQLTLIVASMVLQMPPEKIRVHWTLSGGGFGRRLLADFVAQAVLVSKAVGRPVKLIWTREEDMTHDFYRPATLTRIAAAVDASGKPAAIASKLVSPTQMQTVVPDKLPPHVDPRVTEGLEQTRYAIPNLRLDYHKLETGVPTSVLRTTGFGPNIFALESFVDELAHAAGQDPYQYRRTLLTHDQRALAVLDLAAAKAGWSKPLPKGSGRGIAFCHAFETLMAQVVELSVNEAKEIRVRRVVTVADPGKVFDPGISASNLEGGVVWGLTSALKSEITFERGRTVQKNFDGYDMLHLWETPAIETHLIESGGDKLGGMGEVGPVAVPPAFANALFAATGERIRTLPVTRHGYSAAYAA